MDWSYMLLLEAVVAAVVVLLFSLRRPRRHSEMGDKFPGPPALPFIGNAHQMGNNSHDIYLAFKRIMKEFDNHPVRIWIANSLFIGITRPKDMEIILGSNKLIDKGDNYKVLHPWLGMGLLTSTGLRWRRNRKILTPAFHFKILEEFVEVFYSNGNILIECLREKVGGAKFNLLHYITLSALDNICETAMGLKINAMKDAESSYVKAVRWQSDIAMMRMMKPWLQNELIFFLSGLKSKSKKALKILHNTTDSVIRSRREKILKERAATSQVSEHGAKRRLAFLDLLIESTFNGSGLTDENIREEVDTFMFEGHDTTSAAITFALWLLAWHQDIQDSAVEEILEVWPDSREPITYQNLQELKLLDRIIKETLRLYPSVPFISRELNEDVQLSGGLVAPKGSNISLLTFITHLDPESFPDPEKFDPDRFLPENIKNRHPYAYTPFSAGPRNCIGQKFAMLEMKCTVAQLLREFQFSPGAASPELRLSPDLILTVKEGVPVTIQLRTA